MGAIIHVASVGIGSVVGLEQSFAGTSAPAVHPLITAMAFAVPVVSFGVLFVAYERTRNIPAAREEQANRPVNAWLPVAIVDAIFLVIALAASALSDPW